MCLSVRPVGGRNEGHALFAANDMAMGDLLGCMSGDVVLHAADPVEVRRYVERVRGCDRQARVVALRQSLGWAAVDLHGSVFAFARFGSLTDANLHTTQAGWVSCARDVCAGEELLFGGDDV